MAAEVVVGDQAYDAQDAVERLEDILLARVEGIQPSEVETEYKLLRRALMEVPGLAEALPNVVTKNRDLRGVWGVLGTVSGQWEPRRAFVREQMRAAFEWADQESRTGHASSGWTGIQSPKERLVAARKLLPLAEATIEGLIAELERPSGNGGPPLEEREQAIGALKELHRVLGELIKQAEKQSLPKFLLDEAAGYAGRAGRALRFDPMPYLVSAGVFGILSALGAGGLAGYLPGVAMAIKKNKPKEP